MKTTIDFPDALLQDAKIVAAQRRTTLRNLVFQGLELVMRQPAQDAEADRKATLRRLLDGMQATNTRPIEPLSREEIYDR
jgi:hypothetical protein